MSSKESLLDLDQNCVLCNQLIKKGEHFITIPCSHLVHTSCLKTNESINPFIRCMECQPERMYSINDIMKYDTTFCTQTQTYIK